MAKQVQKPKSEKKEDPAPPAEPADMSAKGEAIKKEADDLMDEIDEVLEQNAEEFVKNFVQRGGE
jgi:ubiquitin-like protein Pup